MKYGNKKTQTDGIFFDSKKEARRYAELKMMLKVGAISNLELQKPFELIPAQYEPVVRYGKNGKRLKDGKSALKKVAYIKLTLFILTMKQGNRLLKIQKVCEQPIILLSESLCYTFTALKLKKFN